MAERFFTVASQVHGAKVSDGQGVLADICAAADAVEKQLTAHTIQRPDTWEAEAFAILLGADAEALRSAIRAKFRVASDPDAPVEQIQLTELTLAENAAAKSLYVAATQLAAAPRDGITIDTTQRFSHALEVLRARLRPQIHPADANIPYDPKLMQSLAANWEHQQKAICDAATAVYMAVFPWFREEYHTASRNGDNQASFAVLMKAGEEWRALTTCKTLHDCNGSGWTEAATMAGASAYDVAGELPGHREIEAVTAWAKLCTMRRRDQQTGEQSKLSALSDDAMMTHADLAQALNVNAESLRKRLDRWRKKNGDGWQEVTEPAKNAPKYLYLIQAIRPILSDALSSQ